MHGFTQYTPTRIIFGKETQKQAGELAKSLKASKVFVVYGADEDGVCRIGFACFGPFFD